MAYKILGGDEFRTFYEDEPLVKIISKRDELVTIELTYHVAEARPGDDAAFTKLTFVDVYEYRFIGPDHDYAWTNEEDFEFTLIEITDSEQVKRLLGSGIYGSRAVGTRLGALAETDLHHYRIGFDEYGTFDILCLNVRDEQFRITST